MLITLHEPLLFPLQNETVYCELVTRPVNASTIEWYDPQGQLVSGDSENEVRKGILDRKAYIICDGYQQSQGGKCECRVDVTGNNLEKLPVCIGEAKPCVTTDCYSPTIYVQI